jgi:hypothetical protein
MGGEGGSSPAGGKVRKRSILQYSLRPSDQRFFYRVAMAKTQSDLLQSSKSSTHNCRIQMQISKSTVMKSVRYANGATDLGITRC